MTHRAVPTMLVVILLWSTADVLASHLEAARSSEITFRLRLLALLRIVQLAIPCLLAVAAARVLAANEDGVLRRR